MDFYTIIIAVLALFIGIIVEYRANWDTLKKKPLRPIAQLLYVPLHLLICSIAFEIEGSFESFLIAVIISIVAFVFLAMIGLHNVDKKTSSLYWMVFIFTTICLIISSIGHLLFLFANSW